MADTVRSKGENGMVTSGLLILVAGILGLVTCGTALCFLPGIFQKQKKELLNQIERNE